MDKPMPPLRNIREMLHEPAEFSAVMQIAVKRLEEQKLVVDHFKLRADIGPGSQLPLGYHCYPLREEELHVCHGTECRCEPEEEWLEGIRVPLMMHRLTRRLS